ncbi:MAG: hypothetical protein ACTSYD_02100 [Candidatus Heimdallarchaeaceae archaeon]
MKSNSRRKILIQIKGYGEMPVEEFLVQRRNKGVNYKYYVTPLFKITADEYLDNSYIHRLPDGEYQLNPKTTKDYRIKMKRPCSTFIEMFKIIQIKRINNKTIVKVYRCLSKDKKVFERSFVL